MPGIVLFGRRWQVGSDDFFFPSVFEISFRILWLIFSIILLVKYHAEAFKCDAGVGYEVYFYGTIILISINIFLIAIICYISTLGTILVQRPRKQIPFWLYWRFLFCTLEFVLLLFGTIWISLSQPTNGCQNNIRVYVITTIAINWLCVLLMIITVFCTFDPLGRQQVSLDGTSPVTFANSLKVESSSIWNCRCRAIWCFCCVCSPAETDAITDVANMLADYFRDLDLVFSDYIAAFILIGDDDETLGSDLQAIIHPQPALIPDWITVDNALYFLKFSIANYGWKMQAVHPSCPRPSCGCDGCFPCCVSSQFDQVIGDDCCGCLLNFNAITHFTELPPEDIVYACFRNSLFEVPFYVAIDRQSKTIVISIRGTLSIKDVLVDLSASAERMFLSDAEADDFHGHKGMVRSAKYVSAAIISNDIIATAYSRLSQPEEFGIMVTGHSLGAGVATLVALLLRETYPEVRCFAYAPPGGLVSERLREHTMQFVCSVIVGRDIVPRLSLGNLAALKRDIVHVLEQCDSPKHQVLATGCWATIARLLCPSKRTNPQADPLVSSTSRYQRHHDVYSECISEPINMSLSSPAIPKMVLPGHILYLVKSDESQWNLSYAIPDDFSRIIIGSEMITDHWPLFMSSVLKSYRRDLG